MKIKAGIVMLVLMMSTGCSSGIVTDAIDGLNPYGNSVEELGTRDTSAILGESSGSGGGKSEGSARKALEAMATYRKAQEPQPYYPVLQPAEVRLMWVPDHLNSAGDLVPAHYYYLKVLDDRYAVQDSFDLESQLDSESANSGRTYRNTGSATPWVMNTTNR